MLDAKVKTALNEHIDSILQNLPSMKAAYAEQIKSDRQLLGFTDAYALRESIVHSIYHDIRHESVMIFARNACSRFPTIPEQEELSYLIRKRLPEIMSVVDSLDWF